MNIMQKDGKWVDTYGDEWDYAENAKEEIDALKEQIAKLQEDNRQLVEQMNVMANRYESLEQHCTALEEDINMWKVSGAMAINPNEEIITWHRWPEERPKIDVNESVKLICVSDIYLWFATYNRLTEKMWGDRELAIFWTYLPKGVE